MWSNGWTDLVQRNPEKACVGVIMNFYGWFVILDHSWLRIRRMPAWHPWGIFLEAKSKRATGDYVLRNIFASKPIRNTIFVSTSMLSGSLNQMMINTSCLYDTFSRWPPYTYEKWRFRSQFRPGYEIPHYVMLCWWTVLIYTCIYIWNINMLVK